MADVNVSLDSSDLPVIVDSLERMRDALEKKDESAEPHPTLQQVNLLINTFKSVQK